MDESFGQPGPAASGGAVCAVHPGAASTGTCERCGNFVCPSCIDVLSPLDDHCESCRDHLGGGLIPFEQVEDGTPFLRRWWTTWTALAMQPTRTLESTRPGAVGASVSYLAFTGFIVAAFPTLCGFCAVGALGLTGSLGDLMPGLGGSESSIILAIFAGAAVLYLVLLPLSFLIASAIRTCIFHLAARGLGGNGGFAGDFWAMNYLQGLSLLVVPLMIIQQIPLIGPLLGLVGQLAFEVYYALQLTTVAKRYHGLRDGRASLAGWSGFIVFVTLGSFLCLALVFLAVALPQTY